MPELMRCAHCGQEYDPAYLDQVLYHNQVPHQPRLATGIVGRRVDEDQPPATGEVRDA